MSDDTSKDVTELTVQLLSAYLANNTVASGDLASLIATTREALGSSSATPEAEPQSYEPKVSAKKSLASPDHIISLIDGKPYKTLKRHLAGHGLTPEDYRERYNLRSDYPMVAPSYSEHRRHVAQNLGLGRRKVSLETEGPVSVAAEEPQSVPDGPVKAKTKPASKAPKARTAAPSFAQNAPVDTAPVVETQAPAAARKAPKARVAAKAVAAPDAATSVAAPEKPTSEKPKRAAKPKVPTTVAGETSEDKSAVASPKTAGKAKATKTKAVKSAAPRKPAKPKATAKVVNSEAPVTEVVSSHAA